MSTATATRRVRLQRYSSTHYGATSADFSQAFDVERVGPGMWTVTRHRIVQTGPREYESVIAETLTVDGLPTARTLIASFA